MQTLLIILIVGFIAQFIDGSLGMGYGVITTSLLLAYNVTPVVASASVHIAKVFTTAAAGVSHMKFKNIDRPTVYRLILPGSIGSFIGACFLSKISGELVKPFIAFFLIIISVNIVVKYLLGINAELKMRGRKWTFIPLGLVAGFLDAIGGGGWGPLVTPVLMTRNELEMRKVIGTVDISKFVISVSATLGFLLTMDMKDIKWSWILALILSGVIIAPFAAYIIQFIKHQFLGLLIGVLLLVTNIHSVVKALHINSNMGMIVYSMLLIVLPISIFSIYVIRKRKSEN